MNAPKRHPLMSPSNIISMIIALFALSCTTTSYLINSDSGAIGKDESLYMTLARGEFSNAPLGVPRGTALDAARCGSVRTADPPGCFMLLHFWEYFGTSERWLRLLPALFNIGSMLSILGIAIHAGLPMPLASAMMLLPTASPLMMNHSLEFRGYGMQFFFTYLAILITIIVARHKNWSRTSSTLWIGLLLTLILLLQTRYSSVFIAISLMLAALLASIIPSNSPVKKMNLLKSAIPYLILISISTLVFICSLHYAQHVKCLDSVNSVAFSDGSPAIEGSLAHRIMHIFGETPKAAAIFRNIDTLGRTGWQIAVLVIGISALLWLFCTIQLTLSTTKANIIEFLHEERIILCLLFISPAILLLSSMTFGILNLHPFKPNDRVSMYLYPATHTVLIGLLRIPFMLKRDLETKHIAEKMKYNDILLKLLSSFIILLLLFYGFMYSKKRIDFRMGGSHKTTELLKKNFGGTRLGKIKYWYISNGESDVFKQQLRSGKLSGVVHPDAAIFFEKMPAAYTSNEELINSLKAICQKTLEKHESLVLLLGHVNRHEADAYFQAMASCFENLESEPPGEAGVQAVIGTK